jgi:hypothetical protein
VNEKTRIVDVKLVFGAAKPKEKTGVKVPGRGGWPE